MAGSVWLAGHLSLSRRPACASSQHESLRVARLFTISHEQVFQETWTEAARFLRT